MSTTSEQLDRMSISAPESRPYDDAMSISSGGWLSPPDGDQVQLALSRELTLRDLERMFLNFQSTWRHRNQGQREFEAGVRQELITVDLRLCECKAEMRRELASMRLVQHKFEAEVRSELAVVRGEFAGLRDEFAEVRGEFKDVRGELAGVRRELVGLSGQLSRVLDHLQSMNPLMKEIPQPLLCQEQASLSGLMRTLISSHLTLHLQARPSPN
ncbi:hypothetical protein L873DRAFT_1050715 [Choiromyces venosus 120613-1]|uniref:Uncharacterized protein n=1 Tax=Choiromyces venosus 120613-1 TaxID=1336337 RepID=A0A3N4JJ90_9PEZI|nr:hypothetical protein L873DRAFT_1050715 [Choiromyces venosus 120613-1]